MEKKIASKKKQLPQKSDEVLINEIRSLIEQTRSKVAQTVNSALVLMNWHISKRINDEVLKNRRAKYYESSAKLQIKIVKNEGKNPENAVLRELENFLLELGVGFTFVARQKRITVDGEDFRIDLLLFHRELRRLVVIELKLGRFMPADFGQTEFYLRWLDKYERKPWEESPIGLILCSEKSNERVELLALDKQEIKVAEY